MFSSKQVVAFFPSFVWVHDLAIADYKPLNEKLLAWLSAMRTNASAYNAGRTWQSDTDLQTRPEMETVNKYVLTAAEGVLDFLGIDRHPMFISGAWGNFGPPGTSHHEHSHPNNYLSAVYYILAPKGGHTINFLDPRPQAHVIAPPVKRPSTNTASLVTLDIAPGRLVLFPAWLRHSVDNNKSEEERLSIAFNVMFENYSGSLSKPRFKSTLNDQRK